MQQSGPPPSSGQPDPNQGGPQQPHRPQQPPYQAPPPPPPPPPMGYGYGPAMPPPPPPQRVHITAKPSGFSRAFGFIFGLMLIGIVFSGGIVIGVVAMFASSGGGQVILEEPYQRGGGQRIAIIPVEGIIGPAMSDFVRDATDYVLDDGNNIDAVILRVDSPGGGVSSSDQIWYEMQRITDSGRPIIASYGGLAASGGYYISCDTDHIMAEPTCVTGSIGVIAQILTLEDMMNKVGIEPITLVASNSPEKDIGNDIFHKWNEQDRETIIEMLDAAYETFFKRVADGRKSVIDSETKLQEIADGSIYTADQAMSNGLIDGIGYLDDAVTYVEQNALRRMVGSAEVVTLRYPPSLFGDGLLMQAHQREMATGRLDAERVRTFANELAAPRLMYLMR